MLALKLPSLLDAIPGLLHSRKCLAAEQTEWERGILLKEAMVELTDESSPNGTPAPPSAPPAKLHAQLGPLLIGVPLLTLLTGLAFPLVLAVLARFIFPYQANGSLIERDRVVVGSELIGQGFSDPGYFHPRPSAAGEGFDATASSGTNLGPANPKLRDGNPRNAATPESEPPFAGVRELTAAYRRTNGLADDAPVPIDAVTRSGSGLDPHISPENAELQVPRVARTRHMPEQDVRRLVAAYTAGRQLGFLGEARVEVLRLNLALDRAANGSR
jgi:potassium-transporting ATPase KdpC subunit